MSDKKETAILRRSKDKGKDPKALIEKALHHLNDPGVYNALPFDTYISAVEPLLRAKHFGHGGGFHIVPSKEHKSEGGTK